MMKRFTILLFFLIFFGIIRIFADCGDSVVVEIWNSSSSGLTTKRVDIFDPAGNIKSSTRYKKDQIWKNDWRTIYERDTTGRLLLYLTQRGNGSTWNDISRDVYNYNSQGDLDSIHRQYNGSNSQYEIYKYDSVDQLIEYSIYRFYNGVWTLNNREEFFYDQNGDDTLKLTFKLNSTFTPEFAYHRIFDVDHNKIQETTEHYNGTQWAVKNISHFTYSNGKNDSIYFENVNPNYLVLIFNHYDSLDRLLAVNKFDWDGSTWIFSHQEDTTCYDSVGNKIYHYNISSGSQNWIYDSAGLLINIYGTSTTSSSFNHYYYYNGTRRESVHYTNTSMSGNPSSSNGYYYYSEIFGSQIRCYGTLASLTADTCSGYSYLWSNGATTPSVNVSQGSYTVTVTHPNGESYTSYPLTVYNTQIPPAYLGNDTLICYPYTLTLSPGINYDTYLWNDSSIFSQIIASTTSYPDTVNYYVTVTDSNNCQSSDSIFVFFDLCSGLNSTDERLIYMYPNPVISVLTVNLPTKSDELILYNASGKLIRKIQIAGQKQLEINFSGIPPGVYYLQNISSNSVSIFRVVKL